MNNIIEIKGVKVPLYGIKKIYYGKHFDKPCINIEYYENNKYIWIGVKDWNEYYYLCNLINQDMILSTVRAINSDTRISDLELEVKCLREDLYYSKNENKKLKERIKYLKRSVEKYKESKINDSSALAYGLNTKKVATLINENKQLKENQQEFIKWLDNMNSLGTIPVEQVSSKYKEIINKTKSEE